MSGPTEKVNRTERGWRWPKIYAPIRGKLICPLCNQSQLFVYDNMARLRPARGGWVYVAKYGGWVCQDHGLSPEPISWASEYWESEL